MLIAAKKESEVAGQQQESSSEEKSQSSQDSSSQQEPTNKEESPESQDSVKAEKYRQCDDSKNVVESADKYTYTFCGDGLQYEHQQTQSHSNGEESTSSATSSAKLGHTEHAPDTLAVAQDGTAGFSTGTPAADSSGEGVNQDCADSGRKDGTPGSDKEVSKMEKPHTDSLQGETNGEAVRTENIKSSSQSTNDPSLVNEDNTQSIDHRSDEAIEEKSHEESKDRT